MFRRCVPTQFAFDKVLDQMLHTSLAHLFSLHSCLHYLQVSVMAWVLASLSRPVFKAWVAILVVIKQDSSGECSLMDAYFTVNY